MSKIFTRTFRVRWSELDASGTVAPAGYLRYLVETAYDWGDALGLGAKNDRLLGLFWLIRETEIRFLRPLRHNDVFDFTIWMVNWQRVRGTRCFELTLKDSGEVIAQGSQHIVAMDAQTGRPTSPPEDIIDNFRLDEPRIFPFERFPKIAAPEKPVISQRQVEWGDLDALEHVNNAIYVTYAEEAAAQDLATRGWTPVKLAESNLTVATRRVHIQYLSPAVWGETLAISTHPLSVSDTGGTRYVGMARADGSPICECILDWELVDRLTGQAKDSTAHLFEKEFCVKTACSFVVLLACCLLSACSTPQAATPTQTVPAELPPSPEPSITPEPVPTSSPVPAGNITYFWPLSIEGFELRSEYSLADPDGFALSFDDTQGMGIYLRVLGGAHAERDEYCHGQPANPATPVTVRGLEGCFPAATGAGFIVEWIENGTRYSVGGMGVSQELALATANNLETLDLVSFLARLAP